MAKAVYYGIGDVARKVKKMYYGVNGVARKVKKGYIGVNGVARLFFSGEGKLSLYGMVGQTSGSRGQYPAATTLGNHVLATGGNTGSNNKGDAIDTSLTITALPTMAYGRTRHAGATAGNYALFACGWAGDEDSDGDQVYTNTVDVYDSSLTRLSPITGGDFVRSLGGASAGTNAVFAGGYRSGSSYAMQARDSAWAISSTLTRTTLTTLSGLYGKCEMGSVTFRNYAVFGPGNRPNGVNTELDIYDDSLTKLSTVPYASGVGSSCGAAVAGGNAYVIFGGGDIDINDGTNTAVAFDASFTKITISTLSFSHYDVPATSAGDFAVFSIGSQSCSYDANLTRGSLERYYSRSNTRTWAKTLGDYALFGGGTGYVYDVYAYLCS